MDPVSAFALACNVLQIVELSLSAAQICKEIYETGSLTEHEKIEKFAIDLGRANSNLSSQLNNTRLSPGDLRIKKLAAEVSDTATEVNRIVGQLKFIGGQNAGRTLVQSIKALSKRKPIGKLVQQLERQDRTLNSVILKELYVRCCRTNVKLEAIIEKLDDFQNTVFRKFENRIEQNHQAAIHQGQISERNIVGEIQDARSHNDKLWNSHNLLQGLSFPEMVSRQNMVHQRVGSYGKTYEWIFNVSHNTDEKSTDPRSTKTHSAFADWLRGQGNDGMFWITGKPGSGKSSLLNYIHTNLRDVEFRDLTPPSNRMVLSHYFFQSDHVALQTSFEGFLRTVCYQVLAADPSLVNDVGPTLNKSPVSQPNTQILEPASPAPWLVHDLTPLCEQLLRAAANKSVVYLLVDGIDEMIAEQQENFITTLRRLNAEIPRLRVCCSARAEVHLQYALRDCTSLQLHELNYEDMVDYCERLLAETSASDLVNMLASNAEGVFLWLYIVTNDVKRHCRYDSKEEIQKRLAACPRELSSLFSHMLKRLDASGTKPKPILAYIYKFSQFDTSDDLGLSTLELLLATQSSSQLQRGVIDEIDPKLLRTIADKCEFGDEQVVMHCAGLVEERFVHPYSPVGSYHSQMQQVRDQMNRDQTRDWLLLASTQHWQLIHKAVAEFLEDSFASHTHANLVQVPLVDLYRHGMRSRVAAIRIRHWLSPDVFLDGPEAFFPQDEAIVRLISVCREVVNKLSMTQDGVQTADEILIETTSAVIHCWHNSLVQGDEPWNVLLRFVEEILLVGDAELQSQVFVLIACGSNLQYAISKLVEVPTKDRLPLAALMFIQRCEQMSTADYDVSTPYIKDMELILGAYNILSHRVNLAINWKDARMVLKLRDVTPWHYVIGCLLNLINRALTLEDEKLLLQPLELCADQGASDEIMIELSHFSCLADPISDKKVVCGPCMFSRVEDYRDAESLDNCLEKVSVVDFDCRIPSVKRLADTLLRLGQLQWETTDKVDIGVDWEDVFQISITRVSPLGTSRVLTPFSYEKLLLRDQLADEIRRLRKQKVVKRSSDSFRDVLKSPEQEFEHDGIHWRMLADRPHEFTDAEKEEINKYWLRKPFRIDEVGEEVSANEEALSNYDDLSLWLTERRWQ